MVGATLRPKELTLFTALKAISLFNLSPFNLIEVEQDCTNS